MFTDKSGNEDFGSFLGLLGGGYSAASDIMSGDTSAKFLRANAAIAGLDAQSAVQKGAEQSQIYQTHLAQTIGKQTAQIGGSGLSMSGSPLRALAQTAQFGAQDVARIQLNAAREAWGFSTTQQGDLQRAKQAQATGTGNAFGALITSGARAYANWNYDGG